MRATQGIWSLRGSRSRQSEVGTSAVGRTATALGWGGARTSRSSASGAAERGRPGPRCALRAAALLSASVLLFSLAPRMSAAKQAKWSQERVTNIATQLAKASDTVYDKIFQLQPPVPGSGGYHSFYRLKDSVRVIRNSADYLATRLQKGGGHDETYPTFRRMMVLIRDAQENARRVGIIPDDTLAAITHAGDLVRRLRPYYEDTAMKRHKRNGGDMGGKK